MSATKATGPASPLVLQPPQPFAWTFEGPTTAGPSSAFAPAHASSICEPHAFVK